MSQRRFLSLFIYFECAGSHINKCSFNKKLFFSPRMSPNSNCDCDVNLRCLKSDFTHFGDFKRPTAAKLGFKYWRCAGEAIKAPVGRWGAANWTFHVDFPPQSLCSSRSPGPEVQPSLIWHKRSTVWRRRVRTFLFKILTRKVVLRIPLWSGRENTFS